LWTFQTRRTLQTASIRELIAITDHGTEEIKNILQIQAGRQSSAATAATAAACYA
jgi:hypothetical protein